MAKCDEGYRCDVCGRDVEAITESELYLRYGLGDVPLELLHLQPERHIRCNPALAQDIVHEALAAVRCDGPCAKAGLDAGFVQAEDRRVTAGFRRLLAIPTLRISVAEYPLSVTPEVES